MLRARMKCLPLSQPHGAAQSSDFPFVQRPDLTGPKPAQIQRPLTDTPQPEHRQAEIAAHSADLAVQPLMQGKTEQNPLPHARTRGKLHGLHRRQTFPMQRRASGREASASGRTSTS